MQRSLLISALLVATIGAPAVDGTEASFRLRGGDVPVAHAVNGYSQSVEALAGGDMIIRIGVPAVAVGAAGGGYQPEPGVEAKLPVGFGLPGGLLENISGDLDAYTRATRVLQWVDRTLDLDNTNTGDQDAASVLQRGGGRCSGLANATVALLTAAGFEARTVSGLLVSDERAVPHRWLECFLPGAGWVPTDPTIGFWIVTPRHMVFRDTVTQLPEVELVTVSGVQPDYPQMAGVPVRPDRGSELICRVINSCGGDIVATLRGGAGVELRTVIEVEGHFSGMLPGRWRLEVSRDGRVVARQTLDLGEGAHHSVAVKIDDDCF